MDIPETKGRDAAYEWYQACIVHYIENSISTKQ